jgi:hypothetical protein
MAITKPSGSPCPKCGDKPAEYQMAGDVMRWRCHGCGAGGVIECAPVESPASDPKPRKHWTAGR